MTTMNGKRQSYKKKLSPTFTPGPYTVICGRGKLCSESPGNKNLKSLVKQFLPLYSQAKTKAEKTDIVSRIINCIHHVSPMCGIFVKEERQPNKDGVSQNTSGWWEVDESFAREKIGCMFRDLLHYQYQSSSKAKQAKKKRQNKNASTSSQYSFEVKKFLPIIGSKATSPLTSSQGAAAPPHNSFVKTVISRPNQSLCFVYRPSPPSSMFAFPSKPTPASIGTCRSISLTEADANVTSMPLLNQRYRSTPPTAIPPTYLEMVQQSQLRIDNTLTSKTTTSKSNPLSLVQEACALLDDTTPKDLLGNNNELMDWHDFYPNEDGRDRPLDLPLGGELSNIFDC